MVCWWVVGLCDGVVDWVVVSGDGFALMPDLELVVTGGEGCGDESSDGDRVRDWPIGEGDLYGVLLGDVTDEGDPSVTEWQGQGTVAVEVISNGDRGWPLQVIGLGRDELSWVAGTGQVGLRIGRQVLSHSTARFDPALNSSMLL